MKMMLQEFLLELYKTKNKKKKNLSWSYMIAMVHGCCKKIKTLSVNYWADDSGELLNKKISRRNRRLLKQEKRSNFIILPLGLCFLSSFKLFGE